MIYYWKSQKIYTVELGYNTMNWTEYLVSLWTSAALTEEDNVMVYSKDLIASRISDSTGEVLYKPMSL